MTSADYGAPHYVLFFSFLIILSAIFEVLTSVSLKVPVFLPVKSSSLSIRFRNTPHLGDSALHLIQPMNFVSIAG